MDSINHTFLTLHVSADGSDGWSGRLAEPNRDGTDGPLATLAAARDVLRRLRLERRLGGSAKVLIHGGLYEIAEPLVFGLEDLGTADTPVTYAAAGDGEVVLAGGFRLTQFEPWQGKTLRLDLRKSGHSGHAFRQLFYNGVRQAVARYPNFDHENPYGGGWLYVDGDPVPMYENGHGTKDTLVCSGLKGKKWTGLDKAEVFIYPRYNWINDRLPITAFNPETGELKLGKDASYEIYPGDRFYVQNVAEELDAPGEWYLDEQNETLYFYPPDDNWREAVITVPVCEHIIEVRGPADSDVDPYIEKLNWVDRDLSMRLMQNPEDIKLGYTSFQGITLDGCDGCAAYVRNARGVKLLGCTVRNTGAVGVLVIGGAQCEVRDCDVYETGNHGIYMSGGMRYPFRGWYKPCGHEAANNYIHHIGVYQKSSAGISINGVGIAVRHNYIHDGPRWGITSRGNDNFIEYNHIRHVNIETSDTAAIYLVDRDWSMRGTKIRFNRIHDILGYHYSDGVWHSPAFAFGIYLDDWTSGVEVYGNLTYRTPRAGVYVHAGQNNVVENNMLLQTTGEGAYFRRWEADKEYHHLGTTGNALRNNVFRRNILWSEGRHAFAYRFDNAGREEKADNADSGSQQTLDVEKNSWESNLFWYPNSAPDVKINWMDQKEQRSSEEWRQQGHDAGSVEADPLLSSPELDDYRLAAGSPADRIGFVPLPLDLMGLIQGEYRKVWPVVEASGAREKPLVKAHGDGVVGSEIL